MASDLSRRRFHPRKDYSGVLMQQGRVQLDSDWNELLEILDRRLRAETVDLLGRCRVGEGAPDAFRITVDGGDLAIGRGRLYVDGLMAENHGLPADGSVFDPVLDEVTGKDDGRFSTQPYVVEAPSLPKDPGTYLVYLRAWRREVTHLEDPQLVEPAVDVDTTSRVQTAWQVRIHPEALDDETVCGEAVDSWEEEIRPSGGRVSVEAVDGPGSDDPCRIPPGGGYKGLENHLYRIEIHDPGEPDADGNGATFKWSRDNAVVASSVTALTDSRHLVVESVGRDDVLRFHDGDWVEIIDDALELEGRPGVMGRIKKVHDATRTLELENPLPGDVFPIDSTDPDHSTDPSRHTRVRRWDQSGRIEDTDGNLLVDLEAAGAEGVIPVPEGKTVELELGVQVTFDTKAPDRYRTGDAWLSAARTADASVEILDEAPPVAIHRHHCRLALLHVHDDGMEVTDCRPLGPATCCISVRPGQDVQSAIDSVPEAGGAVCLMTGVHRVRRPLLVDRRRNLVLRGCGLGSQLVYDPFDGATNSEEGPLFVSASCNVRIEDLTIHSRSSRVVVVGGSSEQVEITDALLVGTGGRSEGAAVLVGDASRVGVRRTALVAEHGVLQRRDDVLGPVRGRILRRRVSDAEGTEERGEAEIRVTVEAARPEKTAEAREGPMTHLWVEGNRILAWSAGISLEDVAEGRLTKNRIYPLGSGSERRRLDWWLRDHHDEGIEDLRTDSDVDSDADPEGMDRREEKLGRLFERHDLLSCDLPEPADDERGGLDEGVVACAVDGFEISGNQIWARAGIVCEYARDVVVAGNRIRAADGGVACGYVFGGEIEQNDVHVVRKAIGESGKPPTSVPELLQELAPRARQPAVVTTFARDLRVRDNHLDAPSGIVSFARKPRCEVTGRSLVRILRIGVLWRFVVAVGFFVAQIAGMLRNEDDVASRDLIEEKMLEKLRLLLRSEWVPAFLGKVRVEKNRLRVDRYGILFDQVFSLGGLRVDGNRVAGHARCGIRAHPLFSALRPAFLAGWIRCLAEAVLEFLELLYRSLRRFLEGGEIGGGRDEDSDDTTLGVGVVTGILGLCNRLCHPGEEEGDDGEDGDEGPDLSPVEDLADALGDLLERARGPWLDDLLAVDYRISGNALRGGGTGIWCGIDDTRIEENEVTVRPVSTVAREALSLAAILASSRDDADATAQLLVQPLLDLDRDRLVEHALRVALGEESPPAGLGEVVAGLRPHLAAGSPLRPALETLDEAISDEEELRLPWALFVFLLASRLQGFGIVIVGSDRVCRDNAVTSERYCYDDGPPAAGGIYQTSAAGAILLDLVPMVFGRGEQKAAHLAAGLVAYLQLREGSSRSIEIARNRVREALAHGIRTLGEIHQDLVHVHDNRVVDATLCGILDRGGSLQTSGFLSLDRGDEAVDRTIEVHRNTVHRTSSVYDLSGYGHSALAGLPRYVRLISIGPQGFVGTLVWGAGWMFLNLNLQFMGVVRVHDNHGQAWNLPGGDAAEAVWVNAYVISVQSNYVRVGSPSLAFRVLGSAGLFTDNVSNRANLVNVSGLSQGPDVITF